MASKIFRMALAAMLFVSCSSTNSKNILQKLSPGIFYKRDMAIKVNGQTGIGTLVVKKSASYKFHIEASGQLDLFTFKTCHREWDKQKAWNVTSYEKRMFWKKKIVKKKEVEFQITPAAAEIDRYCPATLTGYERRGGRHSWGFVDFETLDEKFPATVHCNGQLYKSNGVTICQSKVGLEQWIQFSSPVVVVPGWSCNKTKITTKDDKLFRWKTLRGVCVYSFVGIKDRSMSHRLTTLGYESILIRGNDD